MTIGTFARGVWGWTWLTALYLFMGSLWTLGVTMIGAMIGFPWIGIIMPIYFIWSYTKNIGPAVDQVMYPWQYERVRDDW